MMHQSFSIVSAPKRFHTKLPSFEFKTRYQSRICPSISQHIASLSLLRNLIEPILLLFFDVIIPFATLGPSPELGAV
jgi:hypothetical protein